MLCLFINSYFHEFIMCFSNGVNIVNATESEISLSVVALILEASTIHFICLSIQFRPAIKNTQSSFYSLYSRYLSDHLLIIGIGSISQTCCRLRRAPYWATILFIVVRKCWNSILRPKQWTSFHFFITHWTWY